MKHTLLAALIVPALAFATPAQVPSNGPSPEQQQQRARTFRVVGLSEKLQLNEAQALKLDEAMRPFDARRQAVHQQMKDAKQTLRAAADGDAAALSKVDAAERQLLDAKAQMVAVQRDMIQSVGQGLTPQQRARMDLFFARGFGGKHGRGERDGREGRGGWRHQGGGQQQ